MPPLNPGGMTVYSVLDVLKLYVAAPVVPAPTEITRGESNFQHSKDEWFA